VQIVHHYEAYQAWRVSPIGVAHAGPNFPLKLQPGDSLSKEVELVISDPSDQKEIPEIWIQARFPFDSSKSDAKLHVLAQNAIAELQRLAAEAQSAAGAIELRS
jgi:hypothetical protein